MSVRKTSTGTLSTNSSSSTVGPPPPPCRYSTLEPIKPGAATRTSVYPRARPRQRASPRPRTYTTPTRGCPRTQAAKPKKSLPKKILSGTGQVLGFCAWVLCFSCVLSGGRELDEKHPHQQL
ncbi:hypothetical protein B9Z19DRAFT_1075609 [Tuber borchii]|uniref:Uncharacterized protein n=1 Tax=Tuber borchii TaxID=42251 RepID=A0A2T7A324_TUBBO|nr:hypothetical protein B9Z19DRAFT_1075609 [Tuber borchii]